MKYCVHKDELVLNVGQPLHKDASLLQSNTAYPSVTSTLGDMTKTSKMQLVKLYRDAKTGREFMAAKKAMLDAIKSSNIKSLCDAAKEPDANHNKVICELKNMPYFVAQGYALGLAYASSLSGDTVSSILIGGMVTVMNGAFECRSGQMIQWYFDFETKAFHAQDTDRANAGVRILDTKPLEVETERAMTEIEKQRKNFNERGLGMEDGVGDGAGHRKRNIAYPKPYLLTADGLDHYGDKIRIFAKCINGGRPYEMVDLMLMTQSL